MIWRLWSSAWDRHGACDPLTLVKTKQNQGKKTWILGKWSTAVNRDSV